VIHVSDSPDDRDIGFAEIDQWHKSRFSGVQIPGGKRIYCGYHYVVRRNGTVEPGRPEWAIGAHVAGHNMNTIGVCWIGKLLPDPRQRASLIKLVQNLMLRYHLTPDKVLGHCELNPGKTCPNIDMKLFREELKPKQEGLA
jgi:N-acetylmuramoyl-L-alanine amidase